MKNKELNSLSEIGKILSKSKSILIFPHGSIDGDALGSSVALCLGLRSLGKICYVMMDEDIPENIRFIENGCCNWDLNYITDQDVSICIDNGELSRIYSRQDLFKKGKTSALIDHHKSSEPFLDYNYIDIKAAASAEIIFDLLLVMGIKITKEIAEAIYVGIVTDTGRFQYSNTTKRTHEIVSELMDYDIDQNKVSVEIYQSVSHAKIKLEACVLNTLRVECEGRLAAAYVTRKMLSETGAKDEDTEGVVEIMRNLRGVEVAVFAKEKEQDEIKVSMRSKFDFDVSQIAVDFQGGGHVNAAGFSCHGDIEKIVSEVMDEIKKKMK